MRETGIVRRIDELGRVVIPKEIRRTQRIHSGDALEIFTDGKGEDKLRTVPSGYKILWLIGGNGDDLSLDNPYGIVKRLHPLEEENSAAEFFFVEKGGYSMNNQEGISLNF